MTLHQISQDDSAIAFSVSHCVPKFPKRRIGLAAVPKEHEQSENILLTESTCGDALVQLLDEPQVLAIEVLWRHVSRICSK